MCINRFHLPRTQPAPATQATHAPTCKPPGRQAPLRLHHRPRRAEVGPQRPKPPLARRLRQPPRREGQRIGVLVQGHHAPGARGIQVGEDRGRVPATAHGAVQIAPLRVHHQVLQHLPPHDGRVVAAGEGHLRLLRRPVRRGCSWLLPAALRASSSCSPGCSPWPPPTLLRWCRPALRSSWPAAAMLSAPQWVRWEEEAR